MKERLPLLVLFLFVSLCSYTQELNGVWKGTLTQQPGGCFPVYNVELQVTIASNQVSGVCYHYSDFTNYVKKNYDGLYNASTKTINIQEHRVMTFHIPQDCTPCIRYFTLTYSKQDNQEFLSGDWGGVVMNGTLACTPGKIVLHRIIESEFNHIKEIRVDTGTLKLDFYDNAEIDGDSISLFLNDKLIFEHIRLTEKAYTVKLSVNALGPSNELIMVAENLGSIPPNTSYMVAIVEDKRYEARLESTEGSSAMIRLIRK